MGKEACSWHTQAQWENSRGENGPDLIMEGSQGMSGRSDCLLHGFFFFLFSKNLTFKSLWGTRKSDISENKEQVC